MSGCDVLTNFTLNEDDAVAVLHIDRFVFSKKIEGIDVSLNEAGWKRFNYCFSTITKVRSE